MTLAVIAVEPETDTEGEWLCEVEPEEFGVSVVNTVGETECVPLPLTEGEWVPLAEYAVL